MSTKEKMETLFETTAEEWGIFRASSYGWLNADESDPEYLGFNCYSLGDFGKLTDHCPTLFGPVTKPPTAMEAELARTSDDFIGLMDLAQVQIVQTIIVGRDCGDIRFPSSRYGDRLFWLAKFSSLTLLAAAVDRLVRLASKLNLLEGKPERGKNAVVRLTQLCKRYETDEYAVRSLKDAEKLSAVVNERHDLIHKLGSPAGQNTNDYYEDLMSEEQGINESVDWSVLLPRMMAENERKADEICKMCQALVDGYNAAIEFGNFTLHLAANVKPSTNG